MEDFPHRTDSKKKELSLESKTEELRAEYRDTACPMQSLKLCCLIQLVISTATQGKKQNKRKGSKKQVELSGNPSDLHSADSSFESRQVLRLCSMPFPYFYSVPRDEKSEPGMSSSFPGRLKLTESNNLPTVLSRNCQFTKKLSEVYKMADNYYFRLHFLCNVMALSRHQGYRNFRFCFNLNLINAFLVLSR